MKISKKLRRITDDAIGGVVGILMEAAVLLILASVGIAMAVLVAWII